MKKIVLVSVLILLLTGCANYTNGKIDKNNSCLKTFCDEEYGVEYIRDYCIQQGGITIRLDEEGNVIHCEGR